MQVGQGVGAWGAGVPERPFVGLRVGGLLRYVAWFGLLVASLMFYVWSRVDVQACALALESVEARMNVARIERDRLRLELATRQDLAALAAAGAAMGLVRDVPVKRMVAP